MRTPLLLSVLAIASAAVCGAETAPSAPACTAPAYAEFDFWVGSWSVTDRNTDKLAGANRIEKVLNGCALLESWTGASGHRGHSLTFYDAARQLWHQTWIDVAGEPLYLDGRLVEGVMTLEGVAPGEGGGAEMIRHRIRWSPLEGGRVRQHWQSSADGGTTWTEVFDGIYAPEPGMPRGKT